MSMKRLHENFPFISLLNKFCFQEKKKKEDGLIDMDIVRYDKECIRDSIKVFIYTFTGKRSK